MLPFIELFSFASCILFTQAKPINPGNSQAAVFAPAPLKTDSSTSLSNVANVSASRYVIHCNEEQGVDLDVDDCNNALTHIKPLRTKILFMEREDPERLIEAVPLPYRLMGDKAHCFIEPTLTIGASAGTVSLDDISKAATELVRKCGFFRQKGGAITNIGGDDNIGLVLGKYQPSITCSSTLPQWRACSAVLYGMQADIETNVWGPPSNPHSQMGLPAVVDSEAEKDHGACRFRVFTTNPVGIDITSWFKMWEAATALYSVCGRYGKGGFFHGLGENHFLLASLTGKTTTIGGKTANLTQVSNVANASLSDA